MANDILGPADAAYAVTVRPADTRTFGAVDSWFKDCTSDDADDGTDVTAAFLNGVLASLRNVWRMNGGKADNNPVVGETNDDQALVKAMQHLIQRGQVLYGVDTGAANALVVTLVPAAVEYKAGMKVRVKVAASNTGPSTINVNGLGAVPIVRRDGSTLLDSDLTAGAVVDLVYDGAKFQLPTGFGRPQLVRNMTLYVNGTTGNDANDGSVGSPLKTLQAAVNLAFQYGPGSFTVTIEVADGSYAMVATPAIPGPNIVINGNAISPGNVIVNTGAGVNQHAILCNGPNSLTVKNLKGQGVGVNSGAFVATSGGLLKAQNTINGALNGNVFHAFGDAEVHVNGPHVVAGNCSAVLATSFGGTVQIASGVVFTISTPIAVGDFAMSSAGGVIGFNAPPIAAFVNPGNVAGRKFNAVLNGVISVAGSGANYLPGSSAGVTSTGGQYS